ncbi:MAG TPA: protein disulfide oxidoreductase, partial [Psychrobacter sp.]|nr:protein disulfide oxidoreductase [Psychrobacter sp.]
MTTDSKNSKKTLKKSPKQKVLSVLKTVLIYGLIVALIYTAV